MLQFTYMILVMYRKITQLYGSKYYVLASVLKQRSITVFKSPREKPTTLH